MSEIREFNELFKELGGEQANVLLGSGFSISFDPNFDYGRLSQLDVFGDLVADPELLFDVCRTNDFERAMSHITHAKRILSAYNPRFNDAAGVLMQDVLELKQSLIRAVRHIHPLADNMTLKQKDSCGSFLSKFNTIFTLNYDLLLMTVLWEERKGIDYESVFRDGFSKKRGGKSPWTWHWNPTMMPTTSYPKPQNVFFLHGAFHLFPIKQELWKLLPVNSIMPISEVSTLIEQGTSPLIIAEGSHKMKERAIAKNTYLRRAHDFLEKTDGTLFIHGCSLNMDYHIAKAIAKSSIQNVVCGIYTLNKSPDEVDGEKLKFTRITQYRDWLIEGGKALPPINLLYYRLEAADAWEHFATPRTEPTKRLDAIYDEDRPKPEYRK